MPRNAITTKPFRASTFTRLLMAASGDPQAPVADQIDYLARYCEMLGARTVVREDFYIDRHFLDEFAFFYARNFAPPANSVRRFHVFNKRFTERELSRALNDRACSPCANRTAAEQALADSYLGFISIRPVAGAPVGRTVLRCLDDGDRRDIGATGEHRVHLANLQLTVTGLPFQQQDEAVGACATAALWSALGRVAKRDGMRAPTPAVVSEAASRHVLTTGRAVPAAAGLTIEQLSEAIRQVELAPEFVSAERMPEVFVAALHAYLLSGIPVVLAMQALEVADDPRTVAPGAGHAVTAVGFQCGDDPDPVLEGTVPLRSAYVKKLYVHDDRLGPYARAFLRPVPRSQDIDECLLLQVETRRSDRASSAEPRVQGLETWLIDSGLAPVYPKLRLGVKSLLTLADFLGDIVETIVESAASHLRVEFYYEQGGVYLAGLNGRLRGGCSRFLRSVALPRWCAVIRWSLGDEPLVEFVFDTTDILRGGNDENSRLMAEAARLLRAVVCFDPAHRSGFQTVAKAFRVVSA